MNPQQLPPGLAGFVAAQDQQAQRQQQAMQQAVQMQGLLAHVQDRQADQALRAALADAGGDPEKALEVALHSGNVAAASKLAPLVKAAQERKLNDQFASTQGGGGDDPDRLDAMAARLAASGHPGAASVAAQAEKRRKLKADEALLASMKSRPGGVAYGGAGDVADQPEQTGLFHSLANQTESLEIAAQARNLQAQMNNGNARSISPQHYQDMQARLAAQHQSAAQARAMFDKRQDAKPAGVSENAGLSDQYGNDPTYKKNVDYWAKLLSDGGTLPPRFAQSGSGKKMMPDILNVVPTMSGDSRAMLANQVELTGHRSQARSVGTRSAAVDMAAGEAREMMPILLETSSNFQRTGYQPINQVLKSFQDKTGSVESRQFGAALNTFINVYARAVSPSGVPTVSDKDHAREVLSTADSHQQLVGLLQVLEKEMVAAQNAPARVRDSQRSAITGQKPETHPPITSPATTAPASGGWSIKPVP